LLRWRRSRRGRLTDEPPSSLQAKPWFMRSENWSATNTRLSGRTRLCQGRGRCDYWPNLDISP